MLNYVDLVEEYVIGSFTKDGKLTARGLHLLKTKEWLLKIYPDADEAMQIAAVAHDIDSAFAEYKFKGGFKDEKYLKIHQDKSAEMMGVFLKKNGAGAILIKKVRHLIASHEVGGDKDQNIVKDVDSIGFFDRNISDFISRQSIRGSSPESLREKIDWMYDRITSEKIKEIARPMHDEAIKLLKGV